MGTAAKAMAAVGEANNPQEIQKIMMQFQKENAKMDLAGEMMDDALDSAFDNEDEEDEADEVMNQVTPPTQPPTPQLRLLLINADTRLGRS